MKVTVRCRRVSDAEVEEFTGNEAGYYRGTGDVQVFLWGRELLVVSGVDCYGVASVHVELRESAAGSRG